VFTCVNLYVRDSFGVFIFAIAINLLVWLMSNKSITHRFSANMRNCTPVQRHWYILWHFQFRRISAHMFHMRTS